MKEDQQLPAPLQNLQRVLDAARRRGGRQVAAIRAWVEDVSRTYRPTVAVVDLAKTGDETIVSGRVSGTFPGSPIRLRYAFALDGEKIGRLDIGA